MNRSINLIVGLLTCCMLLGISSSSLAAKAKTKREQSKGLAVNLMPQTPKEPTKPDFSVMENGAPKTFATAQELVEYFKTLPADVQKNGMWVTTVPFRLLTVDQKLNLDKLKKLCPENKIYLSIQWTSGKLQEVLRTGDTDPSPIP